jgi:hypothetical protein
VRAALFVALLCFLAARADAQVTRVEVTSRVSPVPGEAIGPAGPYENLQGRIHGEIDPRSPHNRIIQDIDRAPRNARGRVEYIATFSLMKPVDLRKASGVLIYSVVNRGNGAALPSGEGHVSLVSGWQGDVVPTDTNQTIQVPVARHVDGSSVTGPVLARFSDLPTGATTAPIRLGSIGSAFYPPETIDTARARLTFHAAETARGVTGPIGTVHSGDWAFADCREAPFPGRPDPSRVCLKNGFDHARIYELVYTAKDPLVLGIGLAATRDIVSFFRYGPARGSTPNPVAGVVTHVVALGTSQAGNFIKTFVHLGFNQDPDGRIIWDGTLPYIAARQTPLNYRFATPGGAATLYEPGSEPVLWWSPFNDRSRGRGTGSLLDRCLATRTCPKVIEAFGSAELWGLRMSPGLVGTDAVADIPLPDNVRRYYMPGTTHGGGRGGFRVTSSTRPTGDRCALPENPNPMVDTHRALTVALVDWVVKGTPPPPSRYPTLADRMLVPATRGAVGFPAIPGVPFSDTLVNVVLDYDFGSGFGYTDLSGLIASQPPRIKQILPTLVPPVNADGNETAGVASVLHQAPLGTYLGWNVQATGFFKGQICGFQGGYVPFALTRAERLASGDPRPSIEERYGTQDGYMCTVRRAAEALVQERFLLRDDADRLIKEASASGILPAEAGATSDRRRVATALCASR